MLLAALFSLSVSSLSLAHLIVSHYFLFRDILSRSLESNMGNYLFYIVICTNLFPILTDKCLDSIITENIIIWQYHIRTYSTFVSFPSLWSPWDVITPQSDYVNIRFTHSTFICTDGQSTRPHIGWLKSCNVMRDSRVSFKWLLKKHWQLALCRQYIMNCTLNKLSWNAHEADLQKK